MSVVVTIAGCFRKIETPVSGIVLGLFSRVSIDRGAKYKVLRNGNVSSLPRHVSNKYIIVESRVIGSYESPCRDRYDCMIHFNKIRLANAHYHFC